MSNQLLPTPCLMSLSDEVLVHILYYLSLSASSLLHLASTHSRLLRLSRDRKVVKSLRLAGASTVTDSTLKQLLPPSLPVESLSLLCCSSLSPSLTCSLLCRLPSLTSLSLVGLRIGYKHLASLLSSLPLLTSLSFTWTRMELTLWEGLRHALEKLTGLQVHLAPSPEEHCPLDQLTQLLALTPHLSSLTVYTHRLPATITDSPARFNTVTNFAKISLKHLNSLVLVLHNRTFPTLMLKQFLLEVTAAVDSSKLDPYWVDLGDSWISRKDLLVLGMPDYRRENHSTANKSLDFGGVGRRAGEQHNIQGCKEMVIIVNSWLCGSDKAENTIPTIEGLESLQGIKVKESKTGYGRDGYKCILLAQTWLTSTQFSHLTCLSSPLCLLLEEQPFPQDHVEPTTGRVSHSKTKATYSTSPLLQLARAVPTLKEMCVGSCGSPHCCRDGDSLLQALVLVRGLRVLHVSDLKVTFPGPLFPALFSSCPNLEELQLAQLQTSNQQLCKDLTTGLMNAPSLKILRMRQKQLGNNMLQKLLEGLQTCTKLEQVILMDPSQSSLTSRVFPAIQAVQLVKARTSIRLFYTTSPLLTLQSAKSLKTEFKALKRKHLVYSLHPPVRGEDVYQWEHLSSLPGDLLESLLCLSSSDSSDKAKFSSSDSSAIGQFSYRDLLQ